MEIELQFTENMIRGKRTKRPRPCSPLYDSSNGEHCLASTLSEEDEDMANCLILLAQSVCVSPIIKEEKTDPIRYKTEKINSRKLTDITSGNKSYYVYECKTCNRTFPSFQALGGHRASHKKPKLNTEEKELESMVSLDTHDQNNDIYEKSPSPDLSPARAQIRISVHDHSKEHSNKPKVHECSICGSEFLSGQALGGHMRKHRPIQLPINRAATSSIDDDKSGDHSVFSLDLNLPPPEMMEDIVVQSKFESFKSMFSSPALVDCPY